MKNNHRAKEIGIVFLIMCVAISLRIYHIDTLAIFLSDQAIDSFAVQKILSGNFTLLGPRASVGQFFNGPIVYYLMLPFYFIMNNDPLAGTVFQIALQIVTIPFLYLIAKRFGGVRAGLFSSIIFSFSPLLIQYSRATFNSYPALFFSTVILYLITTSRPSKILLFIAGILTGMLVQMHYFLFLYAFGYFVYLILQSRDMKKCFGFAVGMVVGLSPFLLFELRHNFLNTRAILSSGGAVAHHVNIWDRLGNVGTSMGSLLGVTSYGGLSILACVCFLIWNKHTNIKLKMVFLVLFTALLTSVLLYKGIFQTHYAIGFMMVFIVALSYGIGRLFPSRVLAWVSLVYIVCFFLFQNGLYSLPADQDGLGLADEREIVSLILEWKKSNKSWNITQDTQRDNRAMPLRYLLSLHTSFQQPLSVEEYSTNQELFLVSPTIKSIADINTWEVMAFGTHYHSVKKTPINPKYSLTYLRKWEN